ncbi:MAG TPA: alpha/beta fold hydrolase, partial [Steroidobacteraceae bacterium]|nr:alpha/beta fold hydrolase [Steroidobacteraceae bacterium]
MAEIKEESSARSVRKGWVDLPHGQVHYRRAGSGPPIVLLHDSPRSSVLHEPVLEALADEFTAIALDTPGYGRSTPLPLEQPEIPDFGRALAATLAALGIERCPVYAFHTSSKIALELLIQDPARTSVVVMDGLSIPSGPPDLEFIRRYMEPFLPSEDGSHVASGWSRARDFHRFFPWFAHTRLARLPLGLPDAEHLHRYATDLFMAGPHYADAYSAAMRYDPLPAIGRIAGRAVFMCREDDVLYPHLDRLPSTLPTGATIERLGPSRHAWITRLRELFREHVASTRFDPPDPLAAPADDSERQGYVPVPAGQIRVRRMGRAGARPAMLLHDVPGSGAQLRELMHGLAIDRTIYVPDLSGLGESSALPDPDLQAYAATLVALIDGLGLDHIDVYAEFLAGPIALAFATVANGRVGRLVLDGLPMPGTAER